MNVSFFLKVNAIAHSYDFVGMQLLVCVVVGVVVVVVAKRDKVKKNATDDQVRFSAMPLADLLVGSLVPIHHCSTPSSTSRICS